MRLVKIAFLLTTVLVFGQFPRVSSAGDLDDIKAAQAELTDAYTHQRYKEADGKKGLCDLLDPDVVFRGSLSNTWTYGADNVIVKRWRANDQCSCANKTSCSPKLQVFTVGVSDLKLLPDADAEQAPIQGSTAINLGKFEMARLAGVKATSTTEPNVIDGRYIMNWVKVGNNWRIKSFDMCATTPKGAGLHECP